ncbi:MAG: class I SAM-dependent methyltransferase, partial [Eubacterium sp.]|nr:class I SAM-dependent methyltransferase [Eubacterium sp.]
MSSYSVFAQYYDFLNQNVDYNAGSRFISGIFKGNKVKTVIDLACGTGVLSEMLGKMGYEIIGSDMSDEMISMAQNRLFESECRFSLKN